MPTKSESQKRLMLAVAHTKGGYGGVPQKVGREFVNADEAVGRLKRKGDPVKKSKDSMKGEDGMSPRKTMAAGKSGDGDFGIMPYHEAHGTPITHPDMKAGTGRKGAMEDGDRGIGDSITHTKGQHPAQAAPDHGPTHPGGHGMGDHYPS